MNELKNILHSTYIYLTGGLSTTGLSYWLAVNYGSVISAIAGVTGIVLMILKYRMDKRKHDWEIKVLRDTHNLMKND